MAVDSSRGGTNAVSRPSSISNRRRMRARQGPRRRRRALQGLRRMRRELQGLTRRRTRSHLPESIRQVALNQALERLESICSVLGVDFRKKLLEMGVTAAEDLDLLRVYDQVDFLQKTVDANYNKLKDIGKGLLREWELCDTPFRKMMAFAHVIAVSDSISSQDVTDAHFLSTLWLIKAQAELERLQKDRNKVEKKEYESQRDKLKDMVSENHLTWDNVGFDPKKKVVPERYYEETCALWKSIKKAKDLAIGRKELVFRMELVRQLIDQKTLPPHIIRGRLESAKNHVEKISKGLPIMYDGDVVTALLNKFEEDIVALENQQKKEDEKKLRMQRIRTRNGRSPSDASSRDSVDDDAD